MLASALLAISSAAGSVHTSTLDGFWISDGYGYLFKAEGTHLEAYELTSLSCIKSWSATRKPATLNNPELLFTGKDAGKIRVLPGPSADVRLFQEDGAASSIVARRIAEPPASLTAGTPNTPEFNFDVFWKTFDEHYPFFEIKGIDWAATGRRFRAGVNSSTTPQALFDLLSAMIQPLQDAHTFVAAKDLKKYYSGSRLDSDGLDEQHLKRTIEIIKARYLRTRLREFCNHHLGFGMLDGTIGFLRIDRFEDYAKGDDTETSARALESALDSIFRDGAKLKGLIIDVRRNDGGADPLGNTVSSRLTDQSYLAYTKQARIDPNDPRRWTPGQEIFVAPTRRPHFYGSVILLTGPETVSAAETFAMSLMGRASSVLRIGENTQGVFSDVLERRLPNGWRFGLPNERYLTRDLRTFDGLGIPPDVRVKVFPKTDLEMGTDGALEKALELLNKH